MGKQFKESTERRMVKVVDEWSPCYPNNEVQLSIVLRGIKPYPKASEDKMTYYVKVTAWGMDDFGVELEYKIVGQRAIAEGRYDFWKHYIFDRVPDGIDKEWFYEHGFTRI